MDFTKLQTPCFIVDEAAFQENIEDFHAALEKNFKSHIIGYSYKTNSLPYILKTAKNLHCYAEVVSDTEYALAQKIGYSPEQIVFNGPIKGEEKFKEAVLGGSIVNLDSHRELRWLSECKEKNLKVGLRVNFNLNNILPHETSAEEAGARFGFNYETGKLKEAVDSIKAMGNVKVVGLHMHVSTHSHSQNIYRELTKKACEIAEEYNLSLEYIDVGGSFFGGGDGGKQYEAYCKTIHDVLVDFHKKDLCVIVEPGASVIANPISFLSRVIDAKETDVNHFVVTDGSRVNLDPFMRKEKYVYEIFSDSEETEGEQIICGYTCMETDRMMTIKNEKKLKENDYILYKIVGSYTMCFNPLFIEYFPRVYALGKDGEYRLVRDKWTVEEYCQKSVWE